MGGDIKRGVHIMTEPAEIVAQLREFAGRETIGEDVFGAITVGGVRIHITRNANPADPWIPGWT